MEMEYLIRANEMNLLCYKNGLKLGFVEIAPGTTIVKLEAEG